MRGDIMRVPYHSHLFPDPPSDFFNMFHRANREYGHVREIPVHYEPFSSNSFNREHQATGNSSIFNDFAADIPEDFWEPVSAEEAGRLEKNSRKSPKRSLVQKEAVIDLCNDDDDKCCVLTCDANNSGASVKSRRRSLSRSRKRFAYKHDETSSSSTTNTAGPSKHGENKEGKVQDRVNCNVEKDLEEASIFKPTLEKKEKQDQRETECIEVDSLEEEMQLQNLCDFFGSDSSIVTPNKSSKNDENISSPPSYPAYDIIKDILDKEGRCVDYIRGDGNCFFRAISKVIYGSETCHSELRQAVVDLLEKYPREFEQFIDGSVHEHIKSMRKLGTWATQTEIYLAATLIQREIYVLSPDHTGDVYRWLLFSPQFVYKESSVYDPCYLTLCHTNGNHYDRIVAIKKKCNCDVPPPQMMGVQGEVDLTDDIV
ncbi:uncharacterized protein LOC133197408 [Saccostrea echinata]|uniref:uncharacterized protein LOC133197408 n=1 Tax=Saccostrea echinata TaxID=191078 RepID=UPI002A7F4A1D|nr:uncharacterized protein LOC133197408 [Saccostrea echinata]